MPHTTRVVSFFMLVLAGAGAFQSHNSPPPSSHNRRQPRPTEDRGVRKLSSQYSSQRVPAVRRAARDWCEEDTPVVRRRGFIQQSAASASLLLLPPSLARASGDNDAAQPYVSRGDGKFQFAYTVTPPASFTSGNKPLKTHLDEKNFSPPDVRGYQFGVTVDPVRIKSIKEFGDPDQVAARVVTAEVNRDGVFDVKLVKDAAEDTQLGCYDVEYISDGKRGTKRFVTRIYVKDGFLYVLTFQSKEAEYDGAREQEVLDTVKSFKPL